MAGELPDLAVPPPPQPLLGRIGAVLSGRLARASAWLFAGSIGAGVLGYVFQILMGRMLQPVEYGTFSAMMALFTVLSAPLMTMTMVVARKVSEYRARLDHGSISHFYSWINSRTAIVSGLVLVAFLVLAPQIQLYLHAPSRRSVLILGVMLFVTFLPLVNNAFLQGLQRFAWMSAIGLLNVALKIVFSASLILLGLGIDGALIGAIVTALAMWLVTYLPVRSRLLQGRGKPHRDRHLSLAQAAPVFAANVAFAAMTQIDMVAVNYYFPPRDAGLYAAASVLGKAVLYLPSGIAMALLPLVAEKHARDEGSAHLLMQAVALAAGLSGFGAAAYFMIGEPIMRVLYGDGYREAGEILRYFGFAMVPLGLVLIAEHFLIAKGRVLFAYLFVLIAPLELWAIYLWHQTLQTVVLVVGASGSLLALVGYGLLYRAFRQH